MENKIEKNCNLDNMINSELVSVLPHDALEKESTNCRHLVSEQSTLGIAVLKYSTFLSFFQNLSDKKKKMCVLFMCVF